MKTKYVNSHIQVSKLLLRNFSSKRKALTEFGIDQSQCVCFLDLAQNTIVDKKITEIDAKYGYYDPLIEDFLGNIETQIGETISKIRSFYKTKKCTYLSEKELENVVDFFEYALIRRESTVDKIKNESVFSFITNVFSHSYIIDMFRGDSTLRVFKEYKANFLINSTTTSLVLPKCMIYSIKISTEKFPWFVMPISDTCAFILQHKDDYNKYLENDSFSYIYIAKDNFIRLLNDFALKEETIEDSAFIISSQKGKAELERLLKNIVN